MYKIQMLNKISPNGLAMLDSDKYVTSDQMEQPDAILVRSAKLHDIDLPGSLKAIARAGAGVNNIPIDRCTDKGIVVFNTPGANANAVKELMIAALLLASRDIAGGIAWAAELKDDPDLVKTVEKGKCNFAGPELMGKSLGVFGLGAIGVMVANTAVSLGMEVYGNDPYITVEKAWMLSRSVKRAADPQTILENCDYIAIHIPSTPETQHFIDSQKLAAMKPGVRIINLSRTDLVDDEAMAAALETGKVSRYVTDFPTPAVLRMKNTIAIPHLGASTPESEENCAVMAVNELRDYLENGNINNSVNFPDLINPRGGDESICVIHKNIPNILAQISAVISEQQLNIENLSSRSKKEIAYSVFEIIGSCPQDMVEKLMLVEGVIRTRVIINK